MHDGQSVPPARLVIRKASGEDDKRLTVVEVVVVGGWGGAGAWEHFSTSVSSIEVKGISRRWKLRSEHRPVPAGLVFHFKDGFT